MNIKAFICGLEGHSITDEEVAFVKAHNPWGFILFARNIDTPEQVQALTKSLLDHVGREDAPILIDQEGGRVQRLRPPYWEKYPSAASIGDLYKWDAEKGQRAAWLLSRLHAFDLLALGVTVDCLPVLDVPSADGHNVIGDRAYGFSADLVATLGQSACEGLIAGGVMPVIKHIPGHGRATADSHHELPRVEVSRAELERTDFAPFKDLNHIPMAMTAHVIYSAIDAEAPATTSKVVMNDIVRGFMKYDGLVMSDDITMNALSGDLTERTHAIFDAGCDIVLHCTGKMQEMVAVAEATPLLKGKVAERAQAALRGIGQTDDLDEADCRAEFAALMGTLLIADKTVGPASVDPTNYGAT